MKRVAKMNNMCYDHLKPVLLRNQQAMIFVHSRGETFVTAEEMIVIAQSRGDLKSLFIDSQKVSHKTAYQCSEAQRCLYGLSCCSTMPETHQTHSPSNFRTTPST